MQPIALKTRLRNHPGFWFAAGLLSVMVGFVYLQTLGFDFVNLDDLEYVVENPLLEHGLTAHAVLQAFSAFRSAYWIPLTWISYLADVSLLGKGPLGFHLTNVLLHLGNVVIFFLTVRLMTGAFWKSFLAAAFLAVHPLHVESVAWVTERKDVLFGLFSLLALLAYVRYVRRPRAGRFLAVAALFLAALMAKPMAVILPPALLILDAWPLGRLRSGGAAGRGLRASRILLEKLPLLVLSAFFALLTYQAQQSRQAVVSLNIEPLGTRLRDALVASCAYLVKAAWPAKLGVTGEAPWAAHSLTGTLLAAAMLAAISLTAWALRRRSPFLAAGWCWYLVTLLPVLGLIRAGGQVTADRFTYFPLLGIYLAVTWSAGGVAASRARRPAAACAAIAIAAAVVAALAVIAHAQARHWRNSVALFEHAIAVSPDDSFNHYHLGDALARAGRLDESIVEFREVLRIKPDYPEAEYSLGLSLTERGTVDEAIPHYREALRLQPRHAKARNNLGVALAGRGNLAEALALFRQAAEDDPAFAEACYNFAAALETTGRIDEAITWYRDTLRRNPSYLKAQVRLGQLLVQRGVRP